jgi:hypothetical protein
MCARIRVTGPLDYSVFDVQRQQQGQQRRWPDAGSSAGPAAAAAPRAQRLAQIIEEPRSTHSGRTSLGNDSPKPRWARARRGDGSAPRQQPFALSPEVRRAEAAIAEATAALAATAGAPVVSDEDDDGDDDDELVAFGNAANFYGSDDRLSGHFFKKLKIFFFISFSSFFFSPYFLFFNF